MALYTRPSTTIGAGLGRSTTLRAPNAYNPRKRYPLVLVLHNYASTGASVVTRLNFDVAGVGGAKDYDDGALMLCPDGRLDGASTFWEYYGSVGGTDFVYLAAIVAEVMSTWSVDPTRVYVVGYSNGGLMALRLSKAYPSLFTACVSVAGAVDLADDSGTPFAQPVPTLFIHGTADATVEYAGNATGSALPGSLAGHGFLGTLAGAARRAQNNGVSGSLGAAYDTVDLVTTGTPGGAGAETSRKAYSNTTASTAVEVWDSDAAHTLTMSLTRGQLVWTWLETHHRGAA